MKKKKKVSRRAKVKNPSLKKGYNSRIRQEYIDMDYISELDDTVKNCELPNGEMVTELEYISIFMKEWNSGGVSKQSEAKTNKIHRTAKEVKDCTDRTNSRNRDQYSIAKAQNRVHKMDNSVLSDFVDDSILTNVNHMEDALIDFIDHSKKLHNSAGDSDD